LNALSGAVKMHDCLPHNNKGKKLSNFDEKINLRKGFVRAELGKNELNINDNREKR
jgi:hypothetical protein